MKISKIEFLNKTLKYDMITFDMFDTLITRRVLRPFDVIKLIDFKVSNMLNIKSGLFIKSWVAANKKLFLKKHTVNLTFDEIYSQIKKIGLIPESKIEKIKKIHFETELDIVIPKKDMLECYNKLVKAGKEIVIISDMYYPSNFLEKILNKCGYYNFKKVIVSCEYGATKQSGKLWKKFITNNKEKNFIHIGDNRHSDFFQLKKYKGNCLTIKSKNQNNYLNVHTSNIFLSIIYGTILNKFLINSPFDKKKISNCYELGYAIFGPVFLYFCYWLWNNSKNKDLLFASREGWYLQKIYLLFKDKYLLTKEDTQKTTYLYTSRRSVLLSNIYDWNDIVSVCKHKFIHFHGDSALFFKTRFNININDYIYIYKITKLNISKVINTAKKYKDEILNEAKEERSRYLNYLSKNISNKSALVDYSGAGTIQNGLLKLTKKDIPGFYITKFPINKYERKGMKKYASLVIKLDTVFAWSYLWKIFESFLTAPHGQFIMIDSSNKPVFAKDVFNDYQLKLHDDVFFGIKYFIEEILDIMPNKWSLNEKDFKKIYKQLGRFFSNKRIPNEIKDLLDRTDVYSGLKK